MIFYSQRGLRLRKAAGQRPTPQSRACCPRSRHVGRLVLRAGGSHAHQPAVASRFIRSRIAWHRRSVLGLLPEQSSRIDTSTAMGWTEATERPMPENRSPVAIIQGSPLFARLPPLAIRKLASNASVHTFHSGETIVRQGEKVDCLTIVADGLLKVLITSSTRSQAILELLRPGDVFGLESCINQIATSAALEALSEGQTLQIGHRLIGETLNLSPRFAQAAITALSATINRRTLQVSDLIFLELHQRLAKLLLGLLPATGGNRDSQLVTLRLPMQQLAQVVGAEPSAVREVMDTFQELGYIERVEGRGIRIRRREHLG